MFHVTKSGYSSSRLPEKAYGRRDEDPGPGEAEEETEVAEVALDETDVLSLKALREDAVERVDGVDELEREPAPKLKLEPERSRRRDIPGKRMEGVGIGLRSFLLLVAAAVTRSISSSAASDAESSSVHSEPFPPSWM